MIKEGVRMISLKKKYGLSALCYVICCSIVASEKTTQQKVVEVAKKSRELNNLVAELEAVYSKKDVPKKKESPDTQRRFGRGYFDTNAKL
jgi:hypothetical protein